LDSLESLTCIKTGHLVELSIQNLIDCCGLDISALPDAYFDCINNMNGVDTEAGYPNSGEVTFNTNINLLCLKTYTVIYQLLSDQLLGR
jgi:hypothetical protein